ncbi:c-type cytochrome domain-containing protein [Niabella yanshanensis]|uniref:C-type cytochrome domain-containing protein n=1 Tax=Niabella yanshanensis TaxID=577386 RepID=A0ABZ0W9V5_9BACT|nr:c-type cytochrome domain-containing protein [Niabella yanshanensis]WQD40068.1 c-type cytochrome domain-containing protein [Niabella yanshanensis]
MLKSFVTLNSITELGGRLHPVVVHLPIGILLLVCLYYIFTGAEKRQSQYSFISIALLAGMLTALAACISGFLLSRSGDYDQVSVGPHQWVGITTAVIAIACYIVHRLQVRFLKALMILLVLCITVAGHLGGSITHGADYLSAPMQSADSVEFKPIARVQEAIVYNDIIKPILSTKCYSCHGSSKQKGKLRLDEPDYILKGGKGGVPVDWNHAEKSILIDRILLPQSDEDHMPPKEKPQLTRQEIDLLHWWVNSGAGFNKKVSQLNVSEKIRPVLTALQTGGEKKEERPVGLPDKEVAAASSKIISALREKGVVVIPVATNSNYLSANFVGADPVTTEELKLLEQLKDQLVWLKLGNKNVRDQDLKIIGIFQNLRRLHLEGNPITDAGLLFLKTLQQLQYLNLGRTRISSESLMQLSGLKRLERLYLYDIAGAKFDLSSLKKQLPGTLIDTGGYKVPILKSDTTVYEGIVEQ